MVVIPNLFPLSTVVLPGSPQKVVQVVAGSHHSGALTASGKVFCWGSNQHGQCGRPPDRVSVELDAQIVNAPHMIGGLISGVHVTQLRSGWSHLLAITGLNVNHFFLVD